MSKNRTRKPKVLESITGDDALAILEVLIGSDKNLAQKIDTIAQALFNDVDIDGVAGSVQMELELLQAEEVWDRSGAKRDGYVDSSVAAWEMMKEVLKPFQDEVTKYQRLSWLKEADLTCQGLLKGLYVFEKESSTEFKDWATDLPSEYFGIILDEWKNIFKKRRPYKRMEKFLQENCPDWTSWAMKSLRS